MAISYQLEPDLTLEDFIDVLSRCSLGVRRPLDDRERIAGMLREADVIVTARNDEGRLIGVSRALTDYQFCTYLSDLAVAEDHQRQGIGRELIARTHAAAGLKTSLILIAAPTAREYYPHIGMQQHPSCWWIPWTP